MLRFLARRYLHGVAARRIWILAVFLPALIYFGISASRADRFLVMQDVAIAEDAPVASTSNPIHFVSMKKVASRPDTFFQDTLALREVYARLHGTAADRVDDRYRRLTAAADRDLSLKMIDDHTARITYFGSEQVLGKALVSYYARRLVKRAEAGLVRSHQAAKKDLSQKGLYSAGETSAVGTAALKGDLKIEANRAFWRPDRAAPLAQALIISFIAVFVFLGVLEWSDPAFKSERQIARYLGVPILGSLPDLTLISDALSGRKVK